MTRQRWIQATRPRRAYLAFFALTMLLLAACNANSISTNKTVARHLATGYALPGQVPAAVSHATDSGPLDSQKTLDLSIGIPLSARQQAQLTAKLAAINDPTSFDYHQFLEPADFQPGGLFGISPTAFQEVKAYLDASGLRVTGVSQSDQFIKVSAKVADIESALQVQLRSYNNGANYALKQGTSPLVKDQGLQKLGLSISGLDNFSAYNVPGCNTANTIKCLRQNANSQGYSATQIQKAYGLDSLISQGIDGSGQSVAFLELSDYKASDIQQYQQTNNLPSGPSPQTIKVDGGAQLDNGTPEVELDMEMVAATAPKAQQYVYEGPNSGQGINDVYSQIVNDNKAKVVSISWGLCEQSTGSAELQTLDQIFQQGAAEGISFFAAAGDDGAYDCGDNNLAVDSPADDPYVTGVGGTSLTLNGSNYGGEKAWSCTDSQCTSQAPKGAGGGGGVSQQFSLPSFQQGLNPSGANGTSNRFVPDVSANADPQTGYAIYCSVSAGNCNGDMVVGGTSAAAPVWAGAAAIINQYLTKNGKTALGNANAALYAAAKSSGTFHDVASGDNLNYQAGKGYDLATGWGSPNVANLAKAIASGNTGSGGGSGGGNPTPTPTPGSGNGGGNPTPTSTPTNGGGSGGGGGGGNGNGTDLITNGGFENGQDPWAQSSAGQYQLIDTENPHSGSYNADFCGYASCDDVIAQAIDLTGASNSITVSYYWYMVTNKSGGCNDHLTVSIDSVNDDGSGNLTLGSPIAKVQSVCDTAANSAYAKVTKTIDVSGASGQTVAIVFEGTTNSDGQNTTRMFVDDVSVKG